MKNVHDLVTEHNYLGLFDLLTIAAVLEQVVNSALSILRCIWGRWGTFHSTIHGAKGYTEGVLIVQFYFETVSDAGRFVYVWVTVQVLRTTKAGTDEPSNQQSYTDL
jgi:non-ribosomal peptide synthetase component F